MDILGTFEKDKDGQGGYSTLKGYVVADEVGRAGIRQNQTSEHSDWFSGQHYLER